MSVTHQVYLHTCCFCLHVSIFLHPIPTGETQYHRYSLATDQAPLGSLERSTQDTRHVSRPALGALLLVTTAPTAVAHLGPSELRARDQKFTHCCHSCWGEEAYGLQTKVTDTFFGDEGRGYVQEVCGGIRKVIFPLSG